MIRDKRRISVNHRRPALLGCLCNGSLTTGLHGSHGRSGAPLPSECSLFLKSLPILCTITVQYVRPYLPGRIWRTRMMWRAGTFSCGRRSR